MGPLMSAGIFDDILGVILGVVPVSDYQTVHAIACTCMRIHGLGPTAQFRRINKVIEVTGGLTSTKHAELRLAGLIHGTHTVTDTTPKYIHHLISPNCASGLGYIPGTTYKVHYVYGKLIELWYRTYNITDGDSIYRYIQIDQPHAYLCFDCIRYSDSYSVYVTLRSDSVTFLSQALYDVSSIYPYNIWTSWNSCGAVTNSKELHVPALLPYKDEIMRVLATKAYQC